MVQCDIFKAEGNFGAAKKKLINILAQVDKVRKLISKPPPFFIIPVIHRLANVLITKNKLRAAEEFTTNLFRSLERNHGKEKVIILKTRALLGSILSKKGEYSTAENILRPALLGFERLFGD